VKSWLERRRPDHPPRVPEGVGGRVLDDHPRRAIGARPDHRGVVTDERRGDTVGHNRPHTECRDDAGRLPVEVTRQHQTGGRERQAA
jgi:hypothetical protein